MQYGGCYCSIIKCKLFVSFFEYTLGVLFQLSPEAIHVNSQTMSGVIAFMIQQGTTLFNIPPKLATDIRAYLAERERRKLPQKKEVYRYVILLLISQNLSVSFYHPISPVDSDFSVNCYIIGVISVRILVKFKFQVMCFLWNKVSL
jgi:hypothetical protein